MHLICFAFFVSFLLLQETAWKLGEQPGIKRFFFQAENLRHLDEIPLVLQNESGVSVIKRDPTISSVHFPNFIPTALGFPSLSRLTGCSLALNCEHSPLARWHFVIGLKWNSDIKYNVIQLMLSSHGVVFLKALPFNFLLLPVPVKGSVLLNLNCYLTPKMNQYVIRFKLKDIS